MRFLFVSCHGSDLLQHFTFSQFIDSELNPTRSLVTVQLTVHRGARGQAWLRLLARRMKPVKLILILNYWPRRATATAARTAGQGVTVDGRRRP